MEKSRPELARDLFWNVAIERTQVNKGYVVVRWEDGRALSIYVTLT